MYGILKLFFGLVLLKFINNSFAGLFYNLMSHELIEDPNDILVRAVGSILNQVTINISYFIAMYLIFWGTVDTFLSINLLKLRLWSYPISLILIGLFTLYEIYRFAHTHSIVLLIIIFIDLFILWLIDKEYKKLSVHPY